MEPKTLQILLVDDDPNLLVTMGDILKVKGFQPILVNTGAAALACTGDIDVALIDLHLEDIPGLELLSQLKNHIPGIECILLTGHASQSSAIEAINAGAYSYFQKPCDIDQLVLSIQRAGEKRAADQALRASEAQYRLLATHISDVIWILDLQTSRFTYVSPSVQGLRGYSAQEALAQDLPEWIAPASLAHIQNLLPERIEQAKKGQVGPYQEEAELLCKNGTAVWTETTMHYHLNPENNHWEVYGVTRNISERKQAEEKLAAERSLLRTLINNLPDRVYVKDLRGRKVISNIADWQASGGKTMEDIIGKTDLETYPPELAQEFWANDQAVIETGIPIINREEPGRDSLGNPVSVLSSKLPLRDGQGKIIGLVGVGRDITSRKRVEEALRESQRQMATLMGNLPGMVFRCKNDPDWTMEFISEGCYSLTGYHPDDLIGNARKSYGQIIHSEDRQMVWDSIQAGLQKKKLFQLNYRIITAQAEVKWVWEQDQGVYDFGGNLIALEGFISDITERKHAEAALQASDERYRGAIAAAGLVPYGIDYKAQRFTFIGEDIIKLTGFPAGEFTPDLMRASLLESHVWGLEGTGISPDEANRRFMAGEIGNWRNDLRIRTRTGEERWVSDISVPVLDADGKVTSAIGIFQDLTERKRAEAELQASRAAEQAFAARLTILSETTTELSRAENIDDLCRRAVELGRERLGFDRLSIFFVNKDSATMLGTFGVDTEGRITDERSDSHPLLPDSNIWAVLRSQTPLLRITDAPLYLKGQEVGQGNHVYAGLWDGNTAIGFITVDNLLRMQPISESDCEIIRLYASAVGHLCSLLRADAKLQASRAAEEAFAVRLAVLSEATTELSKAEGIDALCRRAVELGRESLDLDRLSIWFLSKDRITMLGTYGVDTEGHITDERTDSFILGEDYPSMSVILDQTPLLHRKDAPLALSGQLVGKGEHITAGLWDGKSVIGYLSVDNLLRKLPFSERDCEIIRLYATAIGHLTSLKRAEQEVRASEGRYRMLAENMSDTIWLMDLDLKITYISPSITKQRGFTLDELNTIPLDQQMTPESFASVVKMYTTELAPERLAQADLSISATLELEMYRKDGSAFWSSNTFTLIRDPHGLPLTILGTARDITESKQAWDALQNSEKRFRALIENNTDAIVLVDPRGRVLYESPAYGRMTGRDVHERLGRSSFEFVHPEDLPAIVGLLNGLVQSPGRIAQAVFRNQHKDASWRWVEATATNLLGESAVQAVVINLHDITDQKQAEQTLKTTERIYRQAITNAGGVPYQMDYASGNYVFLGEGIQILTGYLPAELTGPLFISCLRQIESYGQYKDVPHDERVRLARQEGVIQEWREDYLFARKDGSLVWLADHSVPVKDGAGKAIGSLGILMDITERKQTEENIRQRVKELEVLYETGLYISSLLEPKEIGRKVIEVLSEKLSWNHASIRLFNSDSQRLELLVLNRPGSTVQQLAAETRRLNRAIAKPGQGLSGWVVQHGQPIRSGDVNSDPRFVRTFKGIRSGLYVPIQVGQRTIGVIGAESERPAAFSEADERLLTTLAAQAGIAMENARLLAETLRQVEELGALADVSSALRTALTRPEIIAVILDQLMMGLFHNDDSCLVACDPFTGVNIIEAGRGKWAKNVGLRLDPGKGLSGRLAQTRLPYQSQDILPGESAPEVEFSDRPEALAGMPLLVQGQFIGSLWIGRTSKKKPQSPVPFSANEMRLLGSVADMAANALQRASLHEQALKHADELLAINNLGRSLAETLDVDQIFKKLDETVWQLLPEISLVAIALYDSEKKQLTCVRFNTDEGQVDPSSLPPAPLEPPGLGTQSEAIHTRQPVIINNLRQRLAQLSFKMDVGSNNDRVTQSGLYAPMLAQGRVIGVLQAQSYTLNRFSQAEAGLLSLVANTAAADIQNAHLFAETQKRLKNLAALHEIDVAISASVDIHVTLDILVEQTVSELNADAAAILLLNPLSRTLDYAASLGFRNHQLKGLHIPLGAGLAGQAALQRQTQSASNLQDGLALHDSQRNTINIYDGEGFMAHYAVPLNAKGQIQGVLEVFLRTPFQPDDDWFSFLETLSRQAAIAVDNSNLFDNLQRSNTNIVLAYDATIQGWSQALELRDKETEGHARRVTERTVQLAQLVGIPAAELEHVRRGTLLHDIGKMGIPDAILLKPDKLTEAEWVIMRRHPVLAYEMLSSIAYLRPALDIPHYHHEKWDGSGYPDGLKGEQIPLYARIFAIVDVYDALTNDRPYRPAWTSAQAFEYIRAQSGKHFDPAIVETFLNMLAREK